MKYMTLENITNCCNGTFYGNKEHLSTEVTGITIDSRKIKNGFLFVPLVGARVDGHDYIDQVIEMGAICTLSERIIEDAPCPYILVESCNQGLKDMALFYRNALGVKVVGVTGSVGKTSTKEMIASVLSTKYSVLKTDGNYNNEIGLPLTIFNLKEEHDIAVLEMGISYFQEMSRLTKVAKPDIAVITNIGFCHLETLESRDGVLKAKSEIFESMNNESFVILNGDDDKLASIKIVNGKKPYFFGLNSKHDIYATDVQNLGLLGTRCTIHLENTVIRPTISIPGEHMVLNALAGAMVGIKLGLLPAEIKTGIEALTPVAGRNNIIKGTNYTIIDDCYNANPISMKASLDVLNTATTRKVAILGDMGELGTDEIQMHYEVGTYAASLDLDLVYCIGKLASHITSGCKNGGMDSSTVIHVLTKEEFLTNQDDILNQNDTILVKSSNFMKFNEIVSKLS